MENQHTALKTAESEITIRLLEIINSSTDLEKLIHQTNSLLHKYIDCEAIGVRLEMNEDYPYFETRGFSENFVKAENRLCARDKNGEVLRDSDGNPVLDCMCGNVIQGRFDSSLPFFSENGSFWSNCTTDLLASTTEEDRQSRTRNRCNGEGYESVALVPLVFGNDRFGLLQFNDKRKNRFNEEKIACLEKMANYLSIALSHKRMEEKLKESEQRFRMVADFTYDWEYWIKPDGHFEYVSPSSVNHTGFTPDDFINDPQLITNIVHPEDQDRFLSLQNSAMQNQTSGDLEFRIIARDGRESWIGHKSQPVFSSAGNFLGLRCSNRDITQRKKVDIELQRYAETKEILLREVNHRVKNNLSSILGMLHHEEKQLKKSGHGKIDELVQKMERWLKGFSLVHDLLSHEDWDSVDLDNLAESLVEEIIQIHRKTSVIKYYITPSKISVSSHIAHHLSLIISELVSNSIKHALQEGKQLKLHFNLTGNSAQTVLEFKDNGPGFPQRLVENQTDEEHTGIKLVKKLVEHTLDGELKLKNNQGAVVYMSFSQ